MSQPTNLAVTQLHNALADERLRRKLTDLSYPDFFKAAIAVLDEKDRTIERLERELQDQEGYRPW